MTDRRAIGQRNVGVAVALIILVLARMVEAYRFSRATSS